MSNFWRRAAFGGLAGIAVLGVYDQHEITTLKAQLADTQSQLTARKATDSPFSQPAAPLHTSAQTWQDLPDRAAITTNVNGLEAATQAREALWNLTYKRSPSCENPPDNAEFVACGNEYANAHRAFLESHPLKGFMVHATN